MIVAVGFDLSYDVSSFCMFSSAPWVCHINLSRKIFGYSKKNPKRGYIINPQPLTIDVDYEKVQMKY